MGMQEPIPVLDVILKHLLNLPVLHDERHTLVETPVCSSESWKTQVQPQQQAVVAE